MRLHRLAARRRSARSPVVHDVHAQHGIIDREAPGGDWDGARPCRRQECREGAVAVGAEVGTRRGQRAPVCSGSLTGYLQKGGKESHTLRLLLKRSAAAVHSVARIHAVGLAREAVQLSATAWMRRILVLLLVLVLLLLVLLLLAVLLVAGVEVVIMVPALGLTVALIVCHGTETGGGGCFL